MEGVLRECKFMCYRCELRCNVSVNIFFDQVHGVIFMIDSADIERLGECKRVLLEATERSTLVGKPILM